MEPESLHRLPTPSLRQQYFNFHKAQGEKKLSTSFSLPNLSENHTYLSPDVQVLTLEELSSPVIQELETTAPPQTPLQCRRFGSSIVPPKKVNEALPKQRLADDVRAVRSAHNSLEHLAKVAKDFETTGRGPEVNAALPHRRMRGLDLLYSVRNDSAMLPKPEDEGGVKEEEDEGADGTRQKAFKLLRTVPYFKTLETAHSGMSWKLSRRCDFFQEAAGQVVFRQGDPAGNCYVLVSGEVAVKIFKPSNEEECW